MTKSWRKRRGARGLMAVAAVLAGAAGVTGALSLGRAPSPAAGAAPSGQACASGVSKLTVAGRGTVTATPNVLHIDLDVHATGADAGAALGADDTATAAVVAALKDNGVAASHIQTTDLTIYPQYADTGSKVTSYAVDNTVVAQVHDLASAGTLIDAAVSAGGNDTQIESLDFSLTHPGSLQDRARKAAVHQAVSHAKSMAGASGEHLGAICSLRDDSSTTGTNPVVPFAYGAAATSSKASVPVESGSQTVTARVTIVYALDPAHASGGS